jgi:hypothetical protein
VCSPEVDIEIESKADDSTVLPHNPSVGYIQLPLEEIRVKATAGDGIPVIRQTVYAKIHKQITVDSEEVERGDYRRGQLAPSVIAQDTENHGIATFNLILISGGRGNYSFEFFTVSGISSKPSKPFVVESLIEKTNILNERVTGEVFLNSPMGNPIRVGGTLRGGTRKASPSFASSLAIAMLDGTDNQFAALAGDIAIVGADGVAEFDKLRFVSGPSGTYTIRFVIHGV